MSPHVQARTIFRAIAGNPTAIAAKRAELLALSEKITGENGTFQITDSQVNGQGFTGKHSSTVQERFHVLSIVVSMLDNGHAGTKTVIPRFL
jgi:hypothetical protein